MTRSTSHACRLEAESLSNWLLFWNILGRERINVDKHLFDCSIIRPVLYVV